MPQLIRYAPRETRISVIDRFRSAVRSFWRPPVPLSAFKGELSAEYGYSGDDYAAGIYGNAVNHNTAFTFSAVYDAVNQISSDVAKLPLNLRKYRQTGGSDVHDSDIHWLFKRAANPETKAMDFRRTLTAHALTWHGGFAEIQRDGLDRPKWLWILTPDRVVPSRERLPKGGYGPLTYTVDGDRIVPPEDMLHIRGFGFDGTMGYDVINLARRAIGLALSAENFGSTLFNQGTYGGILSTEDDLDPDQQKAVRAEINKYKSGFQQFLTLFERKWTYQATKASSTDVGLERTREQQIEDVARFFNMPLYKLKVAKPGAMSYASVEANSVDYLTGCLMNWLVQWETELNFKLVPNLEKRQQFFKHNTAAIVRGDIKARYDAYAVLVNLGILSADEVRELEDMNPQEGGTGAMYLVQGALVPKNKIEDQIDAKIAKDKRPPPALVAPPTDPKADAEAGRMLQELSERAERAEQAVKDALEQAGQLRTKVEVLDGVGEADKATIDALRDAERQALSLAATLTEQAQSLRLEHQAQLAAIEAQRATEAEERARLAADRDAAQSAAATAQQALEAVQQASAQTSDKLRDALTAERAANDALTAMSVEATDAKRSLEQAQLSAVEIRAEADEWKTIVEEFKAKYGTASEESGQAQAEATAARGRADAAEATARAAEQQAEVRSAECATARASADASEGARSTLAADLESLRSVEAEARAALARAEEALTAAQAQTTQTRRERDETLAALTQQEADTASEREKRTAAETAIALSEERLKAAEARVEAVRGEGAEALGQAQAELDALRRENATLIEQQRAEAERLKDERSINSRLVTDHETRLAALKDEKSALEQAAIEQRNAAAAGAAAVIATHRELVVHTMRLMIERESDRARRAQGSPEKFSRWMETFYDGHEELLRSALLPAVKVHLAFIRSDESAVEMTRRLVAGHVDESRRQLLTVLDGDADALAGSVAALMHRWESERTTTIADRLMQKELDYVRTR